MSTLEKIHFDAIMKEVYPEDDGVFKAAKECTRITLLFAIDQLKIVHDYLDVSKLDVKEITANMRMRNLQFDKMKELESQLKELDK